MPEKKKKKVKLRSRGRSAGVLTLNADRSLGEALGLVAAMRNENEGRGLSTETVDRAVRRASSRRPKDQEVDARKARLEKTRRWREEQDRKKRKKK